MKTKPISSGSLKFLLTFALVAGLCLPFQPGCHAADTPALQARSATAAEQSVQQERDNMYTLLAYAVVFKNWQNADSNPARGHNIGSVLVDPSGRVVHWARNCNKLEPNGTQHGEVRLMRQYQSREKLYSLEGYTIYTTLEPCAMCSGMMVLQKVSRTVYGMTDPDYGKAIERLQYDSSAADGYKPYPRSLNLTSDLSECVFCKELDDAYKAAGTHNITGWLLGPEAHSIYAEAFTAFQNLQIQHEENKPLYEEAKALLTQVPDAPEAP